MPDNANNSTASAHAQCSANAQHIGNTDYAANTQHTGHSQVATPDEMNPEQSSTLSSEQASVEKQKVFIIGLPRTGTTSVSVALLEQGLKVAHMAFTKAAFIQADAISDAPCFSDYQQLDCLFPQAKFVYLNRNMAKWVPSMQMLLGKMLPHLDAQTGRFHPILKRSFRHVFAIDKVNNPLDSQHLIQCYQTHHAQVLAYFAGRDDFISIDISQAGSLGRLLQFLALSSTQAISPQTIDRAQMPNINAASTNMDFPKLNAGRHVAAWHEYKHPNKISANAAGVEQRKFFSYKL